MHYNFCYNTKKSMKYCKEVKRVLIDSVLNGYQKCVRYDIKSAVSEYISYIDEEPFFVSPTLNSVKADDRVSTLNPKFILFSAPGATGKSALAKYIAAKYNALYWDLPKTEKIGANTFYGSILRAVGPPKYSEFLSDLNKSKVMLVIDAFDEAEIISGRKMLCNFIAEISDILTEYSSPSVILLARTETAQYMASFCAENSIPISHYEIGFFQETIAKEFIEKSVLRLEQKKDPGKKALTSADIDCVNAYFDFVQSNITPEERYSFLGYAPVLEAISVHIAQYSNRAKLLSEMSNKPDCTAVIMSIMEDLLKREQETKVVPAFKKRCSEILPEFTGFENLYSSEEQIARIINYILFEDTQITNYPVELPPELIAEYQSLLDLFLPQHPFVRRAFGESVSAYQLDFTGPAFRDYTLALMLQNEILSDYVKLYFDESHSKPYLPSQIYFDCYIALSNNTISSEHLAHVYDSFRAKTTIIERPYLHCSEIFNDDNETYSYFVTFGMLGEKTRHKKDEITMSLSVVNNELHFEQLSNVSIDTPHLRVKIGTRDMGSRITDSSIVCDIVEWAAETVSIESNEPEGCLIVTKSQMEGLTPTFEIVSSNNLRISAQNIKHFHRLIPFKYDFEDSSDIDDTKFVYALRCIMSEFRTDKKDMLAKMIDRIEHVVVGSSPIKRAVLDYLKAANIIYEANHLYKVNEPVMQGLGIHFTALARMDTKALAPAYEGFVKWRNASC